MSLNRLGTTEAVAMEVAAAAAAAAVVAMAEEVGDIVGIAIALTTPPETIPGPTIMAIGMSVRQTRIATLGRTSPRSPQQVVSVRLLNHRQVPMANVVHRMEHVLATIVPSSSFLLL